MSSWIIGRGLLGRSLVRAQIEEPFDVRVPWRDHSASVEALTDGLDAFLAVDPGRAEIYWSAGRGITSTPGEVLAREVEVFHSFVDALAQRGSDDRSRVSFFLASSVGGAYAGSSEPPFTERTSAVPASAYGEAKLEMESVLLEATVQGGWLSFIGRITNLYGPGQTPGKGQGLISATVSSFVTGRPISIFVPLDTLRDYIYEDDAARMITAGMGLLLGKPRGTTVTKIVSGMGAVSISAILAEQNRLRRRRSPIILGGSTAAGQAADLRVRSEVWPELSAHARTTLSEGLDAVYRAQLAEWNLRY